VQVSEARYGDGGMDDFDTYDGAASDPFDSGKAPLNDAKRESIRRELEDEIPFDLAA
jgi:hypothetical protein